MPTPSWTVSFTMPTASNSPAKACAGHEANRTRRLDQPPSPVTQIHRPARLATRAASFRYGGRHHSGIPGDIIPLYPGDFVGIRTSGSLFPELMGTTVCQSGPTSAPRLPQTVHTNRGSISESRASSGQPSAMTAIEWLHRRDLAVDPVPIDLAGDLN